METCVVCTEPIRCARAFQCGHAVCAVCLVRWLARPPVRCMTCRTPALFIAPVFAVAQTDDPTEEEKIAMAVVDTWRPGTSNPSPPVVPSMTGAEDQRRLAQTQADYLRCQNEPAYFITLSGEARADVLLEDILRTRPAGVFVSRDAATPMFDRAFADGTIPDEAFQRTYIMKHLASRWTCYSTAWPRLRLSSRIALLTDASFRPQYLPTEARADLRLMKNVCLVKPTWIKYCAVGIRDPVAIYILDKNRGYWPTIPKELRTPAVCAAAGRQACGCSMGVVRHVPSCKVGK